MSETLLAVIEFVSSHPWIVLVIPAVFIMFQLTVVRPRNAQARRRMHADQAAQRAVRDLHGEVRQRAKSPGGRE